MTQAVLATERLTLRHLAVEDAEFILAILNDPDFIRNVSNKPNRTIDEARSYVVNGPMASYEQHGFGLYCVSLQETGQPIGICGLIKRETLADVDIGFAFLPDFCSQGYGRESAMAVMVHARSVLGLQRLVAITDPDNQPSIRLLEKMGFRFDRMVQLVEGQPELRLFVVDL